ncbi:MAG: hypothetical protein R2828_05175 [Saprospiraceae bacterium]
MLESAETIIKVIKQKDEVFSKRPHLDFQTLRREGLKHIGELSGKIWTDHNTHDPGVTILEALCYALIDLGYRTTLPIKDLLATEKVIQQEDQHWSQDDNFLTPLEALSGNPTTITDYRKLLLEIRGVRNAWLAPAEEQEIPLYLHYFKDVESPDPSFPKLSCDVTNDSYSTTVFKLNLNGLYHIFLEKYPDADNKAIIEATQKLLSAHRNLCEDFRDITILAMMEVGICADVELTNEVPAEIVYEQIIKRLKDYISPELKYYTLQQLLDKNKPIEDVFAGRPYLTESYGFVDTDELEGIVLRSKLYMSDVYNEILEIDGVKAIRRISFQGDNLDLAGGNLQCLPIPKGKVPVFTIQETCIELRNGDGVLSFNKEKIHKAFVNSNKALLKRAQLDLRLPQGTFHPDIGTYYSIQNDFPTVYGIGEGGLPDTVSEQRKAQASQLKAYLLFYDQLLANYLAQIANLRAIFSNQRESERKPEDKHTYFSQELEAVPGIEQLLKKYATENLSAGTVLAMPVVNNPALTEKLQRLLYNPRETLVISDNCSNEEGLDHLTSNTRARCEMYIRQSILDVSQGDYIVEVHQDKGGYFFVLCFTQVPDMVLIGFQRYSSVPKAREAANLTAFLATIPDNYRKMTRRDKDEEGEPLVRFLFDLVYSPLSYAKYLQDLLEDQDLYCQRRDAFLNHLLARFAEQFTDYTLLQFGATSFEKQQVRETIEAKSTFLSQYDEVSRNRGRAFDYMQPSWGTDNISGFEKRAALLSGMPNWNRRSLCNFEVVESLSLVLLDANGRPLFTGRTTYQSEEELILAIGDIFQKLRDPGQYAQLSKQLSDLDFNLLRRTFSTIAEPENIIISSYTYKLQLKTTGGELKLESSKQDYINSSSVWRGLPLFLQEISAFNPDWQLAEIGEKTRYFLDKAQLEKKILPIITYKWHLHQDEGVLSSEKVFASPTAALDDFVQTGAFGGFINGDKTAFYWKMQPIDGIPLSCSLPYQNRNEARKGWLRTKVVGQAKDNYTVEWLKDGSVQIRLRSDNDIILAEAVIPQGSGINEDTYITACQEAFLKRFDEVAEYQIVEGFFSFYFSPEKTTLLESYFFYPTVNAAIKAMMLAYQASQNLDNYYKAGSEENPEYRVLVRDKYGRFIASSPSPEYNNIEEREAAYAFISSQMRKSQVPFELLEEPRRFSWAILNNHTQQVLETAAVEFYTEIEAVKDCNQFLLRVIEEGKESFIYKNIYCIAAEKTPSQYKFIYYGDNRGVPLHPLLISQEEWGSIPLVKQAYSEFVNALPNAIFDENRLTVSHAGKLVATFFEVDREAESGRQMRIAQIKKLLPYFKTVYSERPKQGFSIMSGWIYRFLKKDAPIAKGYCFNSREEAAEYKDTFCEFHPHPLPIIKNFNPLICPAGDPDKFHYQIWLPDKSGKMLPFFISYLGYDTQEAALNAYEANWLQIIELAADGNNYDKEGGISTEESYAKNAAFCQGKEDFLAVLLGDKAKAIELAKLFPIRVKWECDKFGSGIQGYRFQGFSLEADKVIWHSHLSYESSKEAIEGYQLFVIVLENPNSCSQVCDPCLNPADEDCLEEGEVMSIEGHFRYHLYEILIESEVKYTSAAAAWDAIRMEVVDPCSNESCEWKGLRQFVEAAESKDNYLYTKSGECYGFQVVDPNYFVARHTCSYATPEERDEAIQLIIEYARGRDCSLGRMAPLSPFSPYFPLGKGYFLDLKLVLKETPQRDYDSTISQWLSFALKTEAIQEEKDRIKVVHPFRKDLLAFIRRDEKEGHGIDINEFRKLLREYPIIQRGDQFCFQFYFEENGSALDEELRICGCEDTPSVEHPAFCGKAFIFESKHCYPCRAAAEQAYTQFCTLIKNPNSYGRTSETEVGPYSFDIVDRTQIIASYPHCRPSKSGIAKLIEDVRACALDEGLHLVEHILLRPRCETDNGRTIKLGCDCLLPANPDLNCLDLKWQEDLDANDPCAAAENPEIPYIPGADPYSFWATVVLPSWTKRFRNADNRHFFMEMLYREVPAMVGLNIVWLNPQDMCKFEKSYQRWLTWMHNPDLLCEEGDPLCDLVKCIECLKNDPPCPTILEAQGDCVCLKDKEDGKMVVACTEETDRLFWQAKDCDQPALREAEEVDAIAVAAPAPEMTQKKKTKPKTAKKAAKTKPLDDTQIRKIINQRTEKYRQYIQSIDNKNVLKTEAFDRAQFFINNPPQMMGYEQLVNTLVKNNLKRKGTSTYPLYLEMITHATLYLLDHLVQQHPQEIPKNIKEGLGAHFINLQEKGLDIPQLLTQWNTAVLEPLFPNATKQFILIMQKV